VETKKQKEKLFHSKSRINFMRSRENGNQVDGEVLQHERMKTSICPRYNFVPFFCVSIATDLWHMEGRHNLVLLFGDGLSRFAQREMKLFNVTLS
jgi:hypothetical protein